MKKIGIFVFFTTILLFPCFVNAQECTNEEKAKLRKLADNVQIKYEYIENYVTKTDEVNELNNRFEFVVTNIPKELIIKETWGNNLFKNETDERLTTLKGNNVYGGINTRFIFYGSEITSCHIVNIKEKNMTLPVYNEFWNNELCKGISEYKYCQKFLSKKIDEKTFKSSVTKYKEENKKENTIDGKTEFTLIDFIKNNSILIISIVSGLVLLIVVTIVVILKRKRRRVL